MNGSIWSEFTDKPAFEPLQEDIDCDVLVIGGGLAGIETAELLRQSGRRVVLAEAGSVGGGITKNTTAVITAQHDTPYDELIRLHGEKKAKAYLDANLQAVEAYRALGKEIDCDFETKPSYRYSLTEDFARERDALRKLGYEAELTDRTDLPFAVKSAIRFPGMAQFHPLKFLYALAERLTVFERTRITEIKDHVAFTESNQIRFEQAVVATHFPFINRTGMFFVKLYQERSYVVALENAGDVAGTYIDDVEDGYYWRNYGDLLIVGKGDHRTGTKTHAAEELEAFVKRTYPQATVKYRWANQDCVSLDSVPYVGKYGRLKDVFTLTGFNLWGMTGAMVGARILTDLMNGEQNEFAGAFDPKRRILRAQLFKNVGTTLMNFILPLPKRCPHLGCVLKYDKAEHSWDCPCHGSRFEEDGTLIDNPATKNARV